jgi:predicted negative regulator of RcsB-dependent stress response
MSIWNWLSNEKNQKALVIVGGAIAALATAGWQVYQHSIPLPNR